MSCISICHILWTLKSRLIPLINSIVTHLLPEPTVVVQCSQSWLAQKGVVCLTQARTACMEVREASVSVDTPEQTENLYNITYLYFTLLENLLANTVSEDYVFMYFCVSYSTLSFYGYVISKQPTLPKLLFPAFQQFIALHGKIYPPHVLWLFHYSAYQLIILLSSLKNDSLKSFNAS